MTSAGDSGSMREYVYAFLGRRNARGLDWPWLGRVHINNKISGTVVRVRCGRGRHGTFCPALVQAERVIVYFMRLLTPPPPPFRCVIDFR